jgi:quercetin dioxygenase-like cupin family protein
MLSIAGAAGGPTNKRWCLSMLADELMDATQSLPDRQSGFFMPMLRCPSSTLIAPGRARPLCSPPIIRAAGGRRHWKEEVMPVKAGVVRAGARTTRRGSAETFTGVVFQDPVITAESPSRLGGSVVTFTPGARTAWHSHPVGQTLFCLSGVGRICFKGEKPQVLNPGDTVNIPPDTMHWHGASPDRLFSHLALSEAGEQGQGAAWGAHVSDAEYNEVASGG